MANVGNKTGTVIPVEKIKNTLFNNTEIRNKIYEDFNVKHARDPKEFSNNLISALRQKSIENPQDTDWSSSDIFERVVLAIASSNFNWASFVREVEQDLKEKLFDYDVSELNQFQNDPTFERELAEILKGQNASQKARSILNWSKELGANKNFFKDTICNVYYEIEKKSDFNEDHRTPITVLCMAAIFANPLANWKPIVGDFNFPGMGVAIASEFLRNLNWDGYKPDRHIIWAINRWKSDFEQYDNRVNQTLEHFEELNVSRAQEILRPVKQGLYAIYATPINTECSTFSEADNLLWAFVSYMKRYKENILRAMFTDLSTADARVWESTAIKGPWDLRSEDEI